MIMIRLFYWIAPGITNNDYWELSKVFKNHTQRQLFEAMQKMFLLTPDGDEVGGRLNKFKKSIRRFRDVFTVFLTQIISCCKKLLMQKLYNWYHISKNGIHIGNFQKIVFFKIESLGGRVDVEMRGLPVFLLLYSSIPFTLCVKKVKFPLLLFVL